MSEFGLRSCTESVAPGRPLDVVICTPVTFPCSAAIGLDVGTGMSFSLTCATVNGSFFCSVPAVTPVMTTWLSRLMSCLSLKSRVWEPADTVTERPCGA